MFRRHVLKTCVGRFIALLNRSRKPVRLDEHAPQRAAAATHVAAMSFMFANAGAARNWSAKQAKPAAGVGTKAPQPLKEAKDNPIVVPPAQAGPTKRPPSPKQGAQPAVAMAVPTTPVVATVPIEVHE